MVDFLGPGSQFDYVTLVGTARCGICTGKMEVPRCAVCSCSVANPSFRSPIESSPQVLAFAKVTIGLRLAETESSNQYVCQTCFSKLEKGSKAEGTLRSTVQDILHCAGHPHDVSVSIRSISCDQGTQTQTDCEEEQWDSDRRRLSKMKGRLAKQRDLPAPVGKEMKTSRPFRSPKSPLPDLL